MSPAPFRPTVATRLANVVKRRAALRVRRTDVAILIRLEALSTQVDAIGGALPGTQGADSRDDVEAMLQQAERDIEALEADVMRIRRRITR